MSQNNKYDLYESDMYVLTKIFSFLNQKTQIRFSGVCKKFVELRNYVYKIKATKRLKNEQLQLYKNINYLDLHKNINITNIGIENLPLTHLCCSPVLIRCMTHRALLNI